MRGWRDGLGAMAICYGALFGGVAYLAARHWLFG